MAQWVRAGLRCPDPVRPFGSIGVVMLVGLAVASAFIPDRCTQSRRVAPGWAWAAGGVGPPRPVRSAKHCDSGERVTEPAAQARPGDRTRRLAHRCDGILASCR